MPADTLATVRHFAAALDAEDYAALAALLADDCQYVAPQGPLRGREAIVSSYSDAGTWAESNIQSIEYESSVRLAPDGGAIVRFVDHLEHHGLKHTHACEQTVYLDHQGQVCRIVHQELPGQREAVDLFLKRIGVSRDARPAAETDRQ